jgi:hypothetical protein
MAHELQWLNPGSPEPAHIVLEAHQLTRQFYAEVQYREEFDQYCAWYEATAAKHRQELHRMKTDWNLLGWFYRGSLR